MRYVTRLSNESVETLEQMHKYHPTHTLRQRGHIILLSNRGFKINDIANILDIERKSVTSWIDRWELQGLAGLYDVPGKGSKAKFDEDEQKWIKTLVKLHSRNLKAIIPIVEEKTGKTISVSSIKRILHKFEMSWRRVRGWLGDKRDRDAFDKAKVELDMLRRMEDMDLIELWYFDESGFSLVPYIPYSWQDKDGQVKLPSRRSKRLNVLGFMRRNNEFEGYDFAASVTTEVVTACIDDFCSIRVSDKPRFIVMDNAPTHCSELFEHKEQEWKKQNMHIVRIPAYSPELNLIEILWRFMKYQWIDFKAYLSWGNLVEEVEKMMTGVGKKYTINFE